MTIEDQRFYELSNEVIRQTIMKNSFSLFFTIKDKRPKNRKTKFRSTDKCDSGYRERERIIKRLMSYFKRIHGIRDKIGPDSELFYYAVSESGKGKDKSLIKDSGHVHLLIGFKTWSKFYWKPHERVKDFINYISGEEEVSCLKDGFKTKNKRFAYLDICTTLKNRGDVTLIYRKYDVAEYFAKDERGTLHHEPFYKAPFWEGDIMFPDRKDLPIDLLTGKVA